MNFVKETKQYYERLMDTIKKLNYSEISTTMDFIARSVNSNGKIYIFGNGGSAATASHVVCDFNKGISDYIKDKFKFICLNDNIPSLTAIANDISYEDVFYHQLYGRLQSNDIIFAISGSGNSKNIIKAVKYAKENGCKVIGASGYNGGSLYQLSDYHLHVPIEDMQIVEDIHMSFDHMMMRVLKDYFVNK